MTARRPLAEPRSIARAGLRALFEPVATRRTFEEAVEQIAEKIKGGELHSGDRLPSERELAAQMRISRPTLREAIKVLAEAGVLEVRRGQAGGIFVASELVPRELRAQPPGDPRRARSPACSRRAGCWSRASPSSPPSTPARTTSPRMARRSSASASWPPRDDFLRNEDLFLQLDLKFHLAMARATRNATIVSLMRSLLRHLEIARDMAMHAPLVPDWTIDIHERTLAAIRAADFPLIESVMDEHLAQLEQIWEKETGRGLVRPLPDFLQPVAERSRALRAG